MRPVPRMSMQVAKKIEAFSTSAISADSKQALIFLRGGKVKLLAMPAFDLKGQSDLGKEVHDAVLDTDGKRAHRQVGGQRQSVAGAEVEARAVAGADDDASLGVPAAVAERAVAHVRKFLGQRLRALRKQRSLSQERLGALAGLSGKFIGEVERGEKSISIDSLYRVSVALEIPLRELTDVRADKPSAVPSEDAEKIFALVSGRRRPEDIRRAYRVLQAIFGRAS